MAYVETGYYEDGYIAEGVYIDWGNKIIYVPRNYMLLVQTTPSEIRQLNLDTFRKDLKALEWSVEGMPFPDTHTHNTTVELGGVTYARVIEIINGYTITFEDGQYAVNLIGANSNVGDVVNLNQVSVRSANSAGLTYSKQIEDQSFLDARVWINIERGSIGTQFPRGTPSDPVSNHDDADAIITERRLPRRFHLSGSLNTASADSDDWNNENWLGEDPTTSSIIFDGRQTIDNSTFRRLQMSGGARGKFSLQEGILLSFSDFEGDVTNTGLLGRITLPSGGSNNPFYSFLDSFSLVPGTDTPIIDFNNNANIRMQFRSYTGGLTFENMAAGSVVSVDLLSGHLKIDASCAGGQVVVRGVGHVTDESNGAVEIINAGLATTKIDDLLSKKVWIGLK